MALQCPGRLSLTVIGCLALASSPLALANRGHSGHHHPEPQPEGATADQPAELPGVVAHHPETHHKPVRPLPDLAAFIDMRIRACPLDQSSDAHFDGRHRSRRAASSGVPECTATGDSSSWRDVILVRSHGQLLDAVCTRISSAGCFLSE